MLLTAWRTRACNERLEKLLSMPDEKKRQGLVHSWSATCLLPEAAPRLRAGYRLLAG